MTDKHKKKPDARPAATVILVRQHMGALQVYLLKRSAKSGFMAGKYVFPGGVVEAEDRDVDAWRHAVDLDQDGIRGRLGGGLAETEAMAYGVAAIRETLEEAGVFLARTQGCEKELTALVEAYRRARINDGTNHGFKQLVASGNWVLAFSELWRWSHWITPKLMHRHFDTRFFLAVMPEGQVCRPDTFETTHGIWVTPEQGLAGNLSGQIPLSPPTLVTLHDLMPYENPEALKAAADRRGWGQPVRPRLIPLKNGAVIVEPWDPMYDLKHIPIDDRTTGHAVAAVGRPFSRLRLDNGIWRPVAASAGEDPVV